MFYREPNITAETKYRIWSQILLPPFPWQIGLQLPAKAIKFQKVDLLDFFGCKFFFTVQISISDRSPIVAKSAILVTKFPWICEFCQNCTLEMNVKDLS